MSNNTTLNAGTGGDVIATDDVAGVKYQRVKLTDGTEDSTTPILAGGGVEAGALRVTVASDSTGVLSVDDNGGSLTVDGTVDTELTTADLDTGAGTDTRAVVGLVLAASGGGLLVGAANPVPISDNAGSLTVDGTVSITANSAVNVAQVGGTNTDTNSGNKSAGTLRVVLATDQPALTNKLLVTPDSVALPANQSVNVSQLAGTTTDTNSGTKSAGTLRVVLATDQPALTNKLLVTPDSVALPANQSVNVSQINGVTPLMGNGVTGTGSHRVTIASDNTAFTVNAAQSGTWTVQPGNTANTTPWLVQDVPGTSGGLSFNGFVGAANNNKTQIKGSAGQLYTISVQNLAATPVYLKVFDKTSANVTAGTTACDYQFMIPGNTAGAGLVLNVESGIAHANGITIMLTAGIGTTDNTSVSANNQVVMIGYK